MVEGPYLQAAGALPEGLFQAACSMPPDKQKQTEEFRLRVGRPMTVLLGMGEHPLDSPPVTEGDLRSVLEQVSGASAHTVLDRVRAGFVTMAGGHRIGLCGEAVTREGIIHTFSRLSSMAIRVARPMCGVSRQILGELLEGDKLCSTLILAPPGAGKTTLLRDLVRALSNGDAAPPMRVGLADERGEIAAMWEGRPQLDVGQHTDVAAGCSKAQGLSLLLRGMNPQVLAMDEITAEEDIEALAWAAGCGVTILASAHGGGKRDLYTRPLYRRLMEMGLFRRLVLVRREGGARSWYVEALSSHLL